eukprot:9247771-Lingulodinium_polyedra.AAC.1
MLAAVYFTVGAGFSGPNLQKMQSIALWTSMYRLPYMLVGDFNITADDMEESAWLKHIGGRVVRPTGVTKTCFQ